MNPYRQPSEKDIELGPRWGATRWSKFWTKHKNLEWFLMWTFLMLVVVPIRIVLWLFGCLDGDGPFDF